MITCFIQTKLPLGQDFQRNATVFKWGQCIDSANAHFDIQLYSIFVSITMFRRHLKIYHTSQKRVAFSNGSDHSPSKARETYSSGVHKKYILHFNLNLST